jgi:hypothetical protein
MRVTFRYVLKWPNLSTFRLFLQNGSWFGRPLYVVCLRRFTKPHCYTSYVTSLHTQEPATSCEISSAHGDEGEVRVSTYGLSSGF